MRAREPVTHSFFYLNLEYEIFSDQKSAGNCQFTKKKLSNLKTQWKDFGRNSSLDFSRIRSRPTSLFLQFFISYVEADLHIRPI